METIMIGSARIDERGRTSGGAAGDQKQKNTPDYTGEVSMQKMYKSSKIWMIMRPISAKKAKMMAQAMKKYCNDPKVGYNQGKRLEIMSYEGDRNIGCDCSSLVRRCVKDATKIDPGNFTTATEVATLKKTGLFMEPIEYVSQKKTPVYDGDILVTKTKGHTVIVVSGSPRPNKKTSYYPKYIGTSHSIVDALAAVGEKDTSKEHRKKIAAANKMDGYAGTAEENRAMLDMLKAGKLVKA